VLLAFQAATVAGEPTSRAHDAMAGHDDADRILAVGESHRPCSAGAPDPLGELTVGHRFAIRNIPQRSPHHALEGRATERHWHVEFSALSREILIELLDYRGERRGVRCTERLLQRAVSLPVHVETGEGAVGGYEGERTYGAVDHGMCSIFHGLVLSIMPGAG
jgi:hypothetical protein